MKSPVSAMLLVKDDRHALALIDQLRPHVEEIVVGLTPNDELTRDELIDAGADTIIVVPGPLNNWARARNQVLAACTQRFVLWADSDDLIDGLHRLPEALTLLQTSPLGRLLCPYDYAIDPDGRVTSRQWRERIVRNDGRFEWRYPCHEVLVAKDGRYGDDPEPRCPCLVWQHVGAKDDPRQQEHQIAMLTTYVETHPDDPWGHHNLGRTLLRLHRPKEAIPHFEQYLATSGWDDEKCLAMLELARAEQQVAGFGGDDAKAMAWIERAAALRPGWFEPHYEMGKAWEMRARMRGDERGLPEAVASYRRAREAIPTTDHPFEVRPAEREFAVHDSERQALEELGDWRGAREAAERALAARPDEGRLRVAIGKYAAAERLERAEAVFGPSTPFRSSAVLAEKGLDILFACGTVAEDWNPAVLAEKGLGGSETAVIEMAKRLRAKGCRVRVYCNSGGDGIYDGVEYRDSRGTHENLSCDVLVAWRMAPLLDFAVARVGKLLWCHDTQAHAMTPRLALEADRVLALSEWHKENLVRAHGLDAERIFTTRNGIDVRRFDPDDLGMRRLRDPHRIIYSSSADRGLQVLLDIWPEILARVPDATLEVCYGLDLWRQIADASGSQQQRYAVHSLERRLKSTPGVTYHGRVDQRRLARMMLEAGVMAYPGWFDETSMIGGMESAAAGLRFVGSARAALKETIGPRGVLLDGDWLDERYQRAFVDEVVRAMTAAEGEWVITREALAAYARENFAWDGVAAQWLGLFETLRAEREAGRMPAYGRTAA